MNWTRIAARWIWRRRLPPRVKAALSLAPFGIAGAMKEYRRAVVHLFVRRLLRSHGHYRHIVVYRKELSQPLQSVHARIPIEVRQATELDVEAITTLAADNPETLYKRLDSGAQCFLAIVAGGVVGFNWITSKPLEEEDVIFFPHEGDVYCLNAFTAEDFRGNLIHTELLYRMLLHAQAAGYKTAYTYVDVENISSWKSHLRMGWEEFTSEVTFFPWERADRGAGRSESPLRFPPPAELLDLNRKR